MTLRSLVYWFACSIAAALAVGATEPDLASTSTHASPLNASVHAILPVPEPNRAFMLFIGIMALAFTYRRAWLNWKREM
jgi:hypothetical protein